MAPSPPLPSQCSTCAHPLDGGDRCAHCGTLHGEFRRCPGCSAKAEVIHKGGMIFVCAACGRPRVPFEEPVARSHAERGALVRAEADLKSGALATGLAVFALVTAAACLGVAGLAFLASAEVFALVAVVCALVFGAAGAFGFVTARGARRRADEQMGEALGVGALDVIRQRGTVSPAQLSRALGVPEPLAEQALARLPARTDVRVDAVVDERAADGQVRYRIAAEAPVGQPLDEVADFDARLQQAVRAKEQR